MVHAMRRDVGMCGRARQADVALEDCVGSTVLVKCAPCGGAP